MNRLFLFALLVYIVSAESCVIQDKKVQRIDLILPFRCVQVVVLDHDYVLISLGHSVLGKTGCSDNRIRRLQQRIRE